VGFFGTFLYDDGHWYDVDPDTRPDDGGHWLLVDIHDSDLTTLLYHPAGPGTGVAYLGVTPRTYFEDDDASAPTDTFREAAGLAAWWAGRPTPAGPEIGAGDFDEGIGHDRLVAKETELIGYLARDGDPEADDLVEDDGPLDDAETFVEIKTARLLTALDLPLPAGLDR
jgi:hypothetical protein